MKPTTQSSRAPQWVRLVALAGAGLLAFVVGARLSSHDPEDDVVEPAARVGAAADAKDDAARPPIREPLTITAPQPQPSVRLSDQVTHNPFGLLNSNAGAVTSALDEARARSVPKTRKEKAPPPPPPPPPPPAPVAPPLPFTAVGSIAGADIGGGQPVAFIRQQDQQLLLVRAGDAIGRNYRVESVTVQRVEFMYLPLMQRQALVLAP